jgi:hypothetical protein
MTQEIEKLINEINVYKKEIFDVNQTIADKVNALSSKQREAQEKLDKVVAKMAAEALKDNDYGCGTHNIDTPLFKVKAVVRKKVKWDESALVNIENQIKSVGQNPEDYIKYKRSVSEANYGKFSDDIKKIFTAARTVEPSAPLITITNK